MNTIDINQWQSIATQYIADFGVKIIAAIAFWIVGRWLIGMALRLIDKSLGAGPQKVDATVLRYIHNIVNVTLNILLVIGILGYFGIQTTTFAALLAAAGVAIGMAWSGLLANFAAGAFLIVLRPFKVGDFVSAAGVTGTIKEIGLFATQITTPDNVLCVVGNNKIFADTIQNYTANPYRRVDLKAQLAGSVDHQAAIDLLKLEMAKIPNVMSNPAPEANIIEFTLVGPVLAVRPYCHNDHYWQVYFDTNQLIREALGKAGFPAPMPAQTIYVHNQPKNRS